MDANQENKVSRNFKVITFFDNHLTTFSPNVPYLTTAVNNFKAKQDLLGSYDMQATESTIGYTLQKAVYRTQLRDATLKVSGALKANAIVNNDEAGTFNATITKSQYDKSRDTDALYTSEKIFMKAQEIGDVALLPYGVNDAMIISLGNLVAQFKSYIQKPKDEKAEGVSAGNMVDKLLSELDEDLILIDALMITQKENFPQLYLQYLNNRAIDDDMGGSSPTPPDFVVSLSPNSYTEITTIPYNQFQRFKAKNTGDDNVNWSLSINNTSFSTPPTTLNAGAESTVLSSTLAPNGDVLLFYNPSANPVVVEVTIVDL